MEKFTFRFLQTCTAMLVALLLFVPVEAHAGILRSNHVLLLCHRTANRDMPENTLESLELAANMGCDIVEVDVRRTLDGTLVLNHDGLLDRFTDTTGEVEKTDLRELEQLDFGAWMGRRFAGERIAHFDDVLRLARRLKIGLYLDIKTKGIGKDVLAALDDEKMTDRVMFGGEWDDIRHLNPAANADASAGVQPGFTRAEVDAFHSEHKVVIANFILNGHEFDLDGMKQALAFGVDGIMVDYPRLGAMAVGRPVETKIASLVRMANEGPVDQRVGAIRDLSKFIGFPLQEEFLHWLTDSDEQISHEAALALVMERPQPPLALLEPITHSASATARSNGAWAIGALARAAQDGSKCSSLLAPLLRDRDRKVVKQALIGLSRCSSPSKMVPADVLVQMMSDEDPDERGLAAVALATHHPDIAQVKVPAQLEREDAALDSFNADWTARHRPALSQEEIDKEVGRYRAQMKELQALARLPDQAALESLAAQAFRPGHDYSMMPILVSGYKLWDRLGENPGPALKALASSDGGAADWAEWALVKAGPQVLPAIRDLLAGSRGDLRRRLIEILAWQGDAGALPILHSIRESGESDRELIDWAVSTIEATRVPAVK